MNTMRLSRSCTEAVINSKKLKQKYLKLNIEREFFGQTKMEYLGFWGTRDDVDAGDKNTSK